MSQIPTAGRIVLYRLSEDDVKAIMKHRQDGTGRHRGNKPNVGDEYPMMIIRPWSDQPGSCVNGQVFLDGNDNLWVTSVSVGEGPRTWSWPVIKKVPVQLDKETSKELLDHFKKAEGGAVFHEATVKTSEPAA